MIHPCCAFYERCFCKNLIAPSAESCILRQYGSARDVGSIHSLLLLLFLVVLIASNRDCAVTRQPLHSHTPAKAQRTSVNSPREDRNLAVGLTTKDLLRLVDLKRSVSLLSPVQAYPLTWSTGIIPSSSPTWTIYLRQNRSGESCRKNVLKTGLLTALTSSGTAKKDGWLATAASTEG